jgi:hypothetical protein
MANVTIDAREGKIRQGWMDSGKEGCDHARTGVRKDGRVDDIKKGEASGHERRRVYRWTAPDWQKENGRSTARKKDRVLCTVSRH